MDQGRERATCKPQKGEMENGERENRLQKEKGGGGWAGVQAESQELEAAPF